MASDTSPPAPHPPRQLDGWKEISAYFGRSVRTVQRWEREFGLPIRRFGLGRSEVVHAYVDDIERWKATAEAAAARGSTPAAGEDVERGQNGASVPAPVDPASPVAARRRLTLRHALPAAAVLLAVVTAAALWPSSGDGGKVSSAGEPATWDAVADTLIVRDVSGKEVWTCTFPYRLAIGPQDPTVPVRIEDVDGDGHKEVLVRVVPSDHDKWNYRFHAFSHAGRPLWTFAHRTGQTFGDARYEPPFLSDRIALTPRPGGGRNIWLISVHSPWFPSVVSKVEANGQASSAYWSNGFITALWEGDLAGSRVVLVGARNNESEGASLALLDAASPSGSAPAADPRYRCSTCPPGGPKHFIQIPKPARLRSLRGTSAVGPIQVDGSGRIVLRVNHGCDAGEFFGDVIYTLDRQLRPISVGLSDLYERSTETLVQKKLIPPLPATPALEEVRRIRWWDGTRFVDLVAPVPGMEAAPAATGPGTAPPASRGRQGK